jgi:hypothetical protein
MPVKALSILYRAKFRDALEKTDWFGEIPAEIWGKDWVVHCQPVGSGVAALKYLAPYIFRVALNNRRIRGLEDERVTFCYKDTNHGDTRFCVLRVEEFIRRFLQHVLPRGFVKVRYYGFFSSTKRGMLAKIRLLLGKFRLTGWVRRRIDPGSLEKRCPTCGSVLRWLGSLQPRVRPPPERRYLEAA